MKLTYSAWIKGLSATGISPSISGAGRIDDERAVQLQYQALLLIFAKVVAKVT